MKRERGVLYLFATRKVSESFKEQNASNESTSPPLLEFLGLETIQTMVTGSARSTRSPSDSTWYKTLIWYASSMG